jgi:hypothetical protein
MTGVCFFKIFESNLSSLLFEKLHHLLFYLSILFLTFFPSTIFQNAFMILSSRFTLDAVLPAGSQYPEGPALTGHLDTGFSRFPRV